MDDFNLSDIDALSMGTNINELNKKTNKPIVKPIYNPNINTQISSAINSVNMNNLIQNVEKDLEHFTDSKQKIDSANKLTEIISEYEVSDKHNDSSNNTELLIFILLFIILNNKFIIEVLENYIPYMNSSYPNLIFRSILFGFIIYKYKKYYNI
jgi:hypothetical protein